MELVSTVKLQRKKKDLERTEDYTAMLSGIILSCLKGLNQEQDAISSLIGKPKKTKKETLYVAVTSSLGLCGGYNLNLMKYLNSLLTPNDEVMMIGTKGVSKYDNKDAVLDERNVSFLDHFSFGNVKKLRESIHGMFLDKEYSKVVLVYTHFKNSLTFVPSSTQILPLNNLKADDELEKGYPPDFYPNRGEVFSLLIPKYLDSILYERITEALVSEEGSRRNAMENATDNADDLRDKLNLEYNKARQSEITSQINEIMSGRLEE